MVCVCVFFFFFCCNWKCPLSVCGYKLKNKTFSSLIYMCLGTSFYVYIELSGWSFLLIQFKPIVAIQNPHCNGACHKIATIAHLYRSVVVLNARTTLRIHKIVHHQIPFWHSHLQICCWIQFVCAAHIWEFDGAKKNSSRFMSFALYIIILRGMEKIAATKVNICNHIYLGIKQQLKFTLHYIHLVFSSCH